MTTRISAPDTPADIELRAVLNRKESRGFVMLAGAGSGKTTSLVKALDYVARANHAQLRTRTQQIACITYTDVAAKEIHKDVGSNPLVMVSTIHSFLWSLAKPFQRDIARWVAAHLQAKVDRLLDKQVAYPPRTRQSTIDKDAEELEKLRNQVGLIRDVNHYTYGLGTDYTRGLLGHEDVLNMVPELISKHSLLARITAKKYPYIFVDESQDTFPGVVAALKQVCAQADGAVCLGFFGDPMQQIYHRSAGAIEPEPGWVPIEKPQNFRSSDAVLRVINQVRSKADGLTQVSGRNPEDRIEGECFFFVLPADDQRDKRLRQVRAWLDRHSTAGDWSSNSTVDGHGAKILMIMHRMAAKRLGFEELYSAFNDAGSQSLKQAFNDGGAWLLRPFEDVIFPICGARIEDSPELFEILRNNGRLGLDVPGRQVRPRLAEIRANIAQVKECVERGGAGSVGAVLQLAVERELCDQDPRLHAFLPPGQRPENLHLSDDTWTTIDAFAACDVRQLEPYFQYVRKQSPYSTQHGTKGAEFRKVIVVLDDEEGASFKQYSYEKLLGIRDLSPADIRNLADGAESVLERTRRLLYVCVSRAVESLAVVLVAHDVESAVAALDNSELSSCGKVVTLTDIES